MSRIAAALVLVGALATASAQAHIASNGFLNLDVHGRSLTGSLELAVRDVELAIGVDANGDGKVTWGELRSSQPRLAAYVLQHLRFRSKGQDCALRFGSSQVDARVDGNYAWLPLTALCASSVRELDIRYDVLDDSDPSHRGLLKLTAGTNVQTAVLGGSNPWLTFAVDGSSRWRAAAQYLQAGVWHIWSGIDHLLFLLSLLLPAVLLRRNGRWEPVSRGRPALVSIVKVVTAFTIAHSITLSLAALNVLHLPSRLTESVIAASIVIAALNNVFPVVTETRARIAFAFGLLHGFGFASVLVDMGLPSGARLLSLVAFNCGIEVGQLAVVLAVMPLAYALRGQLVYQRGVVPWGSAAIATLALVWFIQRAFLPL
ncbi:MAG: HupE/UreJ family protein [Proteobacteria bacterium]|nr:HupE/UreJ family protein [Pseudomonadota bacterium]